VGRPKKVRHGDAVLTREHIVATAMRLADTDGIEQLSMRRLATELDCGVMSLYHYITDKETLVEALVDQVASEVVPPTAGLAWRTAAQHIAESTLAALLRHPWAIPVWSTTWPGPYRFDLVEQLLEALADAELPPDIADLGFHAVTNHIQGFAQQRISYHQLNSGAEASGDRLEAMLARGEYPRVAEHVEFHRSDRSTHDEFGFALDLILDGLARFAERQQRLPNDVSTTRAYDDPGHAPVDHR